MILNKKIYRNMSIISFTIVFILALNLIIPMFTQAEENQESIEMKFSVNSESNTLEIKGKIPSEYNGYELYWANKKFSKEKPTNPEDNAKYLEETIKWFEDSENKLKNVVTVEGNTAINDSVQYEAGKFYSVLCIAHGPKNVTMMSVARYTSKVPVEVKAEPVKIELNNLDKKILIHAYDEKAKINVIKIKKSDVALKVEDFKDDGTVIDGYEASNDVKVITTVDSDGIYYVYAENEQGSKCVEPIVIRGNSDVKQDVITVDVYRITDEKFGDIAIRAISETGKVTEIKYFISDSPINVENEEVRNRIKESGSSLVISQNPKEEIVISDSQISDDKYIAIIVKSSDGTYTYEYWKAPGRIGNLEKVEVAPWENGSTKQENEEVQEEELKEENEQKNEGPVVEKQEEQKQEEQKQEEQKQEETKQEEQKQEETKQEETKQEETKQENEGPTVEKHEETKGEEQKQEEPKQENEGPTVEKQEETKGEEPKQEETKQENEGPAVEKQEETKKEEPKQEEPKQEEPKQENEGPIVEKQEETKKEETKNENKALVVEKQEEPKKQEEQKQETKQEKTEQKEEKQELRIKVENSEEELLEEELEEQQETNLNTYVSPSGKKELPQTGNNNILVVFGIVLFSASGIFGLVKYKKED